MSKKTPAILGSLSHLCLSVSDYEKSIKFYDTVLTKLGFEPLYKEEYYTSWLNKLTGGQIGVSPARENLDSKHSRYSIGFHHLALNAATHEQIDDFYEFLLENKYEILDKPKEYDYVPGYYAVFWADPDGMKLELCHVPIQAQEDNEPQSVDDNEPEGKDHDGNGEKDESSPKRQKTE